MKTFISTVCVIVLSFAGIAGGNEFSLSTIENQSIKLCRSVSEYDSLEVVINYSSFVSDTVISNSFVISDGGNFSDTISFDLQPNQPNCSFSVFIPANATGSFNYTIYPIYDNVFTDLTGPVDDTANVSIDLFNYKSNDRSMHPLTYKCAGASVELKTDSSFSSFNWIGLNGYTDSFSAINEGWHVVELTDSNGCTQKDSTYVENRLVPEVIADDSVEFCPHQNVLVELESTFLQQDWSNGDTSHSSILNQAGLYTVEVLDQNHCVHQDSIVLTHFAKYSSFGSDTLTGCYNEIVQLNDPFIVNQNWLSSSTNSIELQENGKEYLTYQDTNGCIWNDSIQLNVLPLPAMTIEYDSILCAGSQNTLKIVTTDVGHWDNNSPIKLIHTPGTYIATVVNSYGCEIVDSVEVVEVNPLLDLGSDITLCDGDLILLSPITNVNNFSWNNGSTSSSLSVNDSGTYSCVGSLQGCQTTDSITVSKAYYPVAEFSATHLGYLEVDFTNLSSHHNQSTWDFGDGNFSTSNAPIYTYQNHGFFQVTLTVHNNCGTDVFTTDVFLDPDHTSEELSKKSLFKVFSPAGSHDIKVLLNSDQRFGMSNYRVINTLGQIITSGKIDLNNPENTVNIPSVESGIYFLTVEVGDENMVFKVLLN